MSCLKKCLVLSNLYLECGVTFDILRNTKKTSKQAGLYRGGSSKILQVVEIKARVLRSKMPLGMGLKDELMEMLLR